MSGRKEEGEQGWKEGEGEVVWEWQIDTGPHPPLPHCPLVLPLYLYLNNKAVLRQHSSVADRY